MSSCGSGEVRLGGGGRGRWWGLQEALALRLRLTGAFHFVYHPERPVHIGLGRDPAESFCIEVSTYGRNPARYF